MKKINDLQKKLKKQKGSISLFVLLSILFFLITVVSVRVSLGNKEVNIDKQYQVVKNNYEKDVGNEDSIYEKKLAVTPHDITVYFQKGTNWDTRPIYAHTWINVDGTDAPYKAWPGELAELVDETNQIYKYVVPLQYAKGGILFHNNSGSQTLDLKVPKDGYIFKVRDVTSVRTVYFSTSWRKQINIHMWGTGGNTTWPGIEMEYLKTIGGRRYFKYDIPKQYQNFLFVEVQNNASTGNKTSDLPFTSGDMLYAGTSTSPTVYSDGTWEKYNP